MGDVRREDLRVVERHDGCRAAHHPDRLDPMGDRCDCRILTVSDADPRTIPGLLEALTACGVCDGSGCMVEMIGSHPNLTEIPCPACDGSGIPPHIRHRLLDLLLELLPVVELRVKYIKVYDRYALMLPENYPHGPKWLGTDEPIKGGDFVGVIPIPLDALGGSE